MIHAPLSTYCLTFPDKMRHVYGHEVSDFAHDLWLEGKIPDHCASIHDAYNAIKLIESKLPYTLEGVETKCDYCKAPIDPDELVRENRTNTEFHLDCYFKVLEEDRKEAEQS